MGIAPNTLERTVYDAHGDVVRGATVESGGVRATTDVAGRFRLADVPPGDVAVRASHPAAGAGETLVPLRSGDEVLTLAIRLK